MSRVVASLEMLLLSSSVYAQSFWDQFRDTDGWFDASDWVLNNAVGFMPVPIVITEPAVGNGIGLAAKLKVMRNDDAIGSDLDYTKTDVNVRQYFKLNEKWVLGLRGELEFVSGDLPFYMVPFIDMRGIPAFRYQGRSVGLVETEARWAFHPRISLVGFLGVGKAADLYSDFSDASARVVQGLGMRYFVARKLGMHVGIDVAKGPEDTYWYLTMGGAWH